MAKATNKSDKNKIMVAGKRKTAVAKALISEGTGIIRINKKPYEHFENFKTLMIQEPIEITKKIMPFNFDIEVSIRGGGQESHRSSRSVGSGSQGRSGSICIICS